ncbi:MAG: hypothetical protein LIO58_01010 [Oscillospiraceae bacterium]|nr:hypothetical protein [Oscillospiraceae bacterium]
MRLTFVDLKRNPARELQLTDGKGGRFSRGDLASIHSVPHLQGFHKLFVGLEVPSCV